MPPNNLPPLAAQSILVRAFAYVGRRIFRKAFGADPAELRHVIRATQRIDSTLGERLEMILQVTRRIENLESAQHVHNLKHRALSERDDGLKVHINNTNLRHDELVARVALMERVLETAGMNPHALWLYANRIERMDASLPLYDDKRRAFHLARYEFAAQYAEGKGVADIACGLGYGTEILRRDGKAASATGVDIEDDTIAYARAVHGGAGIDFVCASGDATGLPDASFDLIASFETIEHVPDDRTLVAEFARLLRPGGMLVCSTPNQWPLAVAPFHVREYDRASFEAVLGAHFTIEAIYNQNSGSNSPFNHGQDAGIVPTTPENEANAECYLAVCRKK